MSHLIAAVATPPIPGAIGILRLSGHGAIAAADALFQAVSGKHLAHTTNRLLSYGSLLDKDGLIIDRVLATVSRGPNSYTGEDTAEFQCHGSPAVLAMALEALYAQGAQPAQPGEFTQRAFLNGKLDLIGAEAVADLLDASTDSAVHTAAAQLGGALSRRVEEVYDGLVDLMAHFHAVLDYPDEDIDPFRAEDLAARLAEAHHRLKALLDSYQRGRHLVRGVPCAIVGRPNAGKSSLLNALLGYERAIVTPIPGTTRDTVEETVRLGHVLLRLIDTAGLRAAEDEAERLGVERSRQAAGEAELVLWVADGSAPLGEEDRQALELALAAPKAIAVFNKADRSGHQVVDVGLSAISISALTGQGLEALTAATSALFPVPDAGELGAVLTGARQAEAAARALEAIVAAQAGLAGGITPDAVLTDVEGALEALGELNGRGVREDIVSRIFSRFCVGK